MSDQEIPDVAHDWLARAYSDLTLGNTALNTPDVLPEDACFHAWKNKGGIGSEAPGWNSH